MSLPALANSCDMFSYRKLSLGSVGVADRIEVSSGKLGGPMPSLLFIRFRFLGGSLLPFGCVPYPESNLSVSKLFCEAMLCWLPPGKISCCERCLEGCLCMLPDRGTGEFSLAALFIAASATDVDGDMLEKKVPFVDGPRLGPLSRWL